MRIGRALALASSAVLAATLLCSCVSDNVALAPQSYTWSGAEQDAAVRAAIDARMAAHAFRSASPAAITLQLQASPRRIVVADGLGRTDSLGTPMLPTLQQTDTVFYDLAISDTASGQVLWRRSAHADANAPPSATELAEHLLPFR